MFVLSILSVSFALTFSDSVTVFSRPSSRHPYWYEFAAKHRCCKIKFNKCGSVYTVNTQAQVLHLGSAWPGTENKSEASVGTPVFTSFFFPKWLQWRKSVSIKNEAVVKYLSSTTAVMYLSMCYRHPVQRKISLVFAIWLLFCLQV